MSQELKAAKLAVHQASSALRLTALASRGLLTCPATRPDEARARLPALKDTYQAALKRCDALAKKTR